MYSLVHDIVFWVQGDRGRERRALPCRKVLLAAVHARQRWEQDGASPRVRSTLDATSTLE